MAPVTFEQLILRQRPHLDHLLRDLARRHYLAAPELEEFRAMVDRALERNDYELLRAFDGRSTWETYLTTVVLRQFFLFQAQLWGQWRPTLAAQRLGAEAMLLEELVDRDKLSVPEAVELMRSRHRVDMPRHRLEHLAAELKLTGGSHGDAAPQGDPRARDTRIQAALRDAMALISPDDRLVLEMRFRDRQPLTRIARVLKVEARPLQRRIEQVLDVLRDSLLTQGIAIQDIEVLLRLAESEDAASQQRWWNLVLARPSK